MINQGFNERLHFLNTAIIVIIDDLFWRMRSTERQDLGFLEQSLLEGCLPSNVHVMAKEDLQGLPFQGKVVLEKESREEPLLFFGRLS